MCAQLEICPGRLSRFDFAGETQAQHAQDVIGKGQARESMRQLAVRHITSELAIKALEAIALATGEHRLEFA